MILNLAGLIGLSNKINLKYRKNKFYQKVFSLVILSIISLASVFSQVGINTEEPHETTDLTLGSTDKGLLPNRIALVSPSSTAPLKSTLKDGTIVYNTTSDSDELSEGLYVWKDGNWNRLLTVVGKITDFKLMAFKQTQNTTADMQVLPYISSSTTLGDIMPSLSAEFTPDKSGSVIINAVIYTKLNITSTTQKFAFVGNTFFRIRLTDTTDGTYTDFISACTPVSTPNTTSFTESGANIATNNNPTAALCQGTMTVQKDHKYQVKIYGQEGWVKTTQGKVTAGTYNWGDYRAYSSLRVDFISDPY